MLGHTRTMNRRPSGTPAFVIGKNARRPIDVAVGRRFLFQSVFHSASAVVLLLIALVIPLSEGIAEPAASPEYLDQGWSDDERDWFYSFSQGSQLLPYSWFRALETATSDTLFADDGLARFGYLPRERSEFNPDGLPVGFTIDIDRHGAWIGMNCAACHTGRVEYRGKTLQIDGAPGNGDLYGLLDDLNKAMQATLADQDKLGRFLDHVRNSYQGLSDAEITAELRRRSGDFNKFVIQSTPTTSWGPARTDAFGMIFNRVTGIDLHVDDNSHPPSAPVSYPFLWTTNQQDFVQWVGSVPNTRGFERLGRNVGQALGVFGQMPNLYSRDLLADSVRYAGSAHIPELLLVDRFTGSLKPPVWPGETDAARVARGELLYQRCSNCHKAATDTTSLVKTTPVPIAGGLDTDPLTAQLILARTAKTDALATGFGAVLYKPQEPAADVLSKVVALTILHPSNWDVAAGPTRTFRSFAIAAEKLARDGKTKVRDAIKAVVDNVRNGRPIGIYLAAASPGSAAASYKAGPLNGIWATAPYLHNGSVPTLADLLLPAAQRPASFDVGSRKLDDQEVGFESAEGSGVFRFDTSKPGNGNRGHEGAAYGTTLSPEERLDLLEYLKTL